MERHGANAVGDRRVPRDGGRTWRPSTTRGSGGMVSFLPSDGGRHGRTAAERAIAIAEGTRLFTLAESLGGVESLIELPAAMTHMSVAGSPLEVDPALVRLSVGIEDVGDLIADLRPGPRRGLEPNRGAGLRRWIDRVDDPRPV